MTKKLDPQSPRAFLLDTDDFLFDDKVLVMTNEEVGVYIKLLSHAWRESPPGYLKNNEKYLARLTNCSPEEWGRVRENVLSCFTEDGEFIFQKRLVQTFEEFLLKRERQTQFGKRGARKRWGIEEKEPSQEVIEKEEENRHPIGTLWPPYSDPIASKRAYIYNNNIINNKALDEKWGAHRHPIGTLSLPHSHPIETDSQPPSSPPPPEVPKTKPNPPVKELIEYYSEKFTTETGQKMHVDWGKAGAKFKKLLNTFEGVEAIKAMIDTFFKSQDPWIKEKGYDFSIFFSQINRLNKKEGGKHGGGNTNPRGNGEGKDKPNLGDKSRDYGKGW